MSSAGASQVLVHELSSPSIGGVLVISVVVENVPLTREAEEATLAGDWWHSRSACLYVVSLGSSSCKSRTTDVQPVEREMFFSSNRLSITSPDTAKKYGYGGLDLYKSRATFFCGIKKPEPCLPCQPCDPNYPCEQPPKPCPVAYTVTLINDNGNDTSVKNGVLEVYIDGKMKEIKGNTFTMSVPSDSMKNYQQGIAIKSKIKN